MLSALRDQAALRFAALRPRDFPALPAAAAAPSSALALSVECAVVFVDGYFSRALSRLPHGLVCLPLETAALSYGSFLQARLGGGVREETDAYALLNAAQHGSGAFLYVPPGIVVEKPVEILHVLTNSGLACPRLHVSLGAGASLTLVETHRGEGAYNGVVDLALERGATLRWVSAHQGVSSVLTATLKREATFRALHATTQGRFAARVHLLEEGAAAFLNGLAMLQGTHASFHTLVEHVAPSCTSRQHVKVALQGASRSLFEGKILVRPEAQKTESYQLNNNLVLSDAALAKSLPNLEIFADDVKASHGATFAQLGEAETFYLRSRGLGAEAARSLLIDAFCRELIELVPLEAVRQTLLEAMHGLHSA